MTVACRLTNLGIWKRNWDTEKAQAAAAAATILGGRPYGLAYETPPSTPWFPSGLPFHTPALWS